MLLQLDIPPVAVTGPSEELQVPTVRILAVSTPATTPTPATLDHQGSERTLLSDTHLCPGSQADFYEYYISLF